MDLNLNPKPLGEELEDLIVNTIADLELKYPGLTDKELVQNIQRVALKKAQESIDFIRDTYARLVSEQAAREAKEDMKEIL